jgi:hypothetical protein
MRASGLITVGFVAAFCLFNLQPYVGLRLSSCQTMYSGLWPLAPGNHLFLPRVKWFEGGEYFSAGRVGGGPIHPYLNREAARVQLNRLCAHGQPVAFQYDEGGVTKHILNACDDPAYSQPEHGIFRRFAYPASLGDADE